MTTGAGASSSVPSGEAGAATERTPGETAAIAAVD